MLIPQMAQCDVQRRQGCRVSNIAELRRQLANPARLNDSNRQCLLDLVNRLARVQALGDEYARVGASHLVQEAVNQATVA